MVETMHTARDCAVNGSAKAQTETASKNATTKTIDRERKVGRAGTIRAVIVVVETPSGTLVAATRAPNLLCRQIAAQHGAAVLCDIITPTAGGKNADRLIVKARRMLRVREGVERPTTTPSAAWVRALRFARTADDIARAVSRKRRAVRQMRLNVVRAALCWHA